MTMTLAPGPGFTCPRCLHPMSRHNADGQCFDCLPGGACYQL